jgi:diguanylate cyclase (GGDEF)-like protein
MWIADEDRSEAGVATGAAQSGGGPAVQGSVAARRSGRWRWILTREAGLNMLLIAVIVSVLWGCIGLHLRQQRAQAGARAERESRNLAQAAAESIGQTIASVDDAMRFMRAIFLADPKHFDIGAWTSRANQTRGVALAFALIDRDGKLLASSLPTASTPSDFSREGFFRSSAAEDVDELSIGHPVAGRAPGRWSLPFTRPVAAADGWLIGIVVAAVDPSWLVRLHRSLETGHGALMLVGADGGIRALALGSAPDSMHGIGMHIDMQGLLDTSALPDRGTGEWVNPVDGTAQVVSYQRLADSGAYVVVGLDAAEVFGPYLLYARQYELFGAGLTLLILLTGCLLLNNTRRLLGSRQLLQDCMDAIGQGIVMVDDNGRMSVVNRRAAEMLRIAHSAAGAGGPAPVALLPAPDADAGPTCEQPGADGTVLEVSTHALAGGAVVRTYADITERKRAEALILHLAMHDSLTGLPNRRLLIDRLAEAIVKAREGGAGGAVLLLDLDRFKTINGTRGHAFGNRVLRLAADRMRSFARDGDVIARIAGDEFCVLLLGQDEPAALAARATELMRLLAEPTHIEDREVLISVSIGIACYPHDGSSVPSVLSRADMALLRAKEGGRATFRIYEPEMDARAADRRQLEQDLRNAMILEQLLVFYQPIFAAETGEIVGVEALLRWFHPTRGPVPPAAFIAIADECGLGAELGFWVLRKACAAAAGWPARVRVCVNLSLRQFGSSDFADRVAAVLAAAGLPAGRLMLELAEGVLIDNRERALAVMSALHKQGIRIAMDGFGTGFSSLSDLHRFPFDSIKIDGSFVAALGEGDDSQAVVRAIVTLGRNLRIKVIAAGVETEAQLRWLQAEGCDEIQGFLLGPPAPAQQIAPYLAGIGPDLAAAPVSDAAT